MRCIKKFRRWYNISAKNPWYWKHIWWSMFSSQPCDNHYIFESLYYQIQYSRWYFSNNKIYISQNHVDRILYWQKIAISLLENILQKKELYKIDYDAVKNRQDPYVCLVNVNTRNSKRFSTIGVDYEIEPNKIHWYHKYMEHEPHELYIQKAKYLLCRILNTYSHEWWD